MINRSQKVTEKQKNVMTSQLWHVETSTKKA